MSASNFKLWNGGTSIHEFYVYYQGATVFARRRSEPPVVAEECESPQAAHDRVQAIVNPEGKDHKAFGPRGFNEDSFVLGISERCREYVEAAYAKAGAK